MQRPNLCARLAVMGAIVLGAIATNVSAQTVVTVCGRDDAPGGTNLSAALAVGGAIVIRCGQSPQTILMTQTYALALDTSIDGEGRVSLIGDGSLPFFTTTRALSLANLTVSNPRASGAVVDTTKTTTAVVVGGRVALTNVRTENTIGPYVVAAFEATDSVFDGNGDPSGESYRAVVEAEAITLRRTTFSKNADHPIGGGASPATGRPPASRSIVIEGSTFSENRFPLLVLDASLVVRGSTFRKNGSRAAESERAWGCCAGALVLVHSVADIADAEFTGNGSSGFGGAVSAIASRVTITRTLFESNASRVGGAVMFWGRAASNNIWSSGAPADPPSLTLERVRFRANVASEIGGALAWSGAVLGDSTLFVNNRARRGGAVAHWSAGSLSAEFADVFGALASLTQAGAEAFAVSRGVFVDNVAAQEAGALDGGDAQVRLGNALVARNRVEAAGPVSALHGAELTLVNATVVGNRSVGVVLSPGARSLTLTNTIVADNERGNCDASSGTLTADNTNLQFPGGSCGSGSRSVAPALDAEYAPSLLSPARYAGDVSTCLGEPLVASRDLHGAPRGNQGRCASGAIEPDIERDLFKNTPFERAAGGPWRWVWWLLLLFLLVGLICGVKYGRRRARRRPVPATP